MSDDVKSEFKKTLQELEDAGISDVHSFDDPTSKTLSDFTVAIGATEEGVDPAMQITIRSFPTSAQYIAAVKASAVYASDVEDELDAMIPPEKFTVITTWEGLERVHELTGILLNWRANFEGDLTEEALQSLQNLLHRD